jgi:hypothetical protein
MPTYDYGHLLVVNAQSFTDCPEIQKLTGSADVKPINLIVTPDQDGQLLYEVLGLALKQVALMPTSNHFRLYRLSGWPTSSAYRSRDDFIRALALTREDFFHLMAGTFLLEPSTRSRPCCTGSPTCSTVPAPKPRKTRPLSPPSTRPSSPSVTPTTTPPATALASASPTSGSTYNLEKKMQRALIALAVLFATPAYAAKDVYVDGYYNNRGTYVQPHHRTSPDSNPYNNYSTLGNSNPWTGQRGTESPYGSRSSLYDGTTGSSSYGFGSIYGR